MKTKATIRSFTDLIVWQRAHSFVVKIYEITRSLPQEEKYALGDQLRRAAVSITNNIAEGFYRKTAKDKSHFYLIALSSIGEVLNQLILLKDLQYINVTIYHALSRDLMEVRKLMYGLLKSAKNKSV